MSLMVSKPPAMVPKIARTVSKSRDTSDSVSSVVANDTKVSVVPSANFGLLTNR